jgi:hypothetical protein
MSGFAVECQCPLFSVITLLDVKIVTITEQFPDPHIMTADWLTRLLSSSVDLASIHLVLISDTRSYFVGELLVHCEDFHGIVLCTEPVYRLGRMLIREISQLLGGKSEPPPTHLCIIPLNFLEPFALGEVCLTPYANGCGSGGCNWPWRS